MWSSTVNKGGKTAPYTIKQSLLRYYMNRWWNNDPDALMVRRNDTMERGLRLTYGYVLHAQPGDTVSFGEIPPHSAALVKIELLGSKPAVVASDMHFAMGDEFKQLALIEGRLHYALMRGYNYPAHYSIWLPAEGEQAERIINLEINGDMQQEGRAG